MTGEGARGRVSRTGVGQVAPRARSAGLDDVAAALRLDRLLGAVEEGDADVALAGRGRDRPLAAGVAVLDAGAAGILVVEGEEGEVAAVLEPGEMWVGRVAGIEGMGEVDEDLPARLTTDAAELHPVVPVVAVVAMVEGQDEGVGCSGKPSPPAGDMKRHGVSPFRYAPSHHATLADRGGSVMSRGGRRGDVGWTKVAESRAHVAVGSRVGTLRFCPPYACYVAYCTINPVNMGTFTGRSTGRIRRSTATSVVGCFRRIGGST